MEENVPHVLSMAWPFKAERSGRRIEWLALFVPRDSTPELSMALDAACDRSLTGSAGQMLAEHMLSLQRHLGEAAKADAPHIARATLALLECAVNAETTEQICGFAGNEQLLRSHVKALIRKEISSAALTPDRLASIARMSRSQLYRLFEPLGGVMRYVHRERLRHAYRLICDPNERRSIGAIAGSVGFLDPSAFSRAFRQLYGCSPRDVRWSGADACGIERMNGKQVGRDAMLDLLRAL